MDAPKFPWKNIVDRCKTARQEANHPVQNDQSLTAIFNQQENNLRQEVDQRKASNINRQLRSDIFFDLLSTPRSQQQPATIIQSPCSLVNEENHTQNQDPPVTKPLREQLNNDEDTTRFFTTLISSPNTDAHKEITKQPEVITSIAKLWLQPHQIIYLLNICQDDLKRIETYHHEIQILNELKANQFTAPNSFHEKIQNEILKLIKSCSSIDFEIQEPGFSDIANAQCSYFIDIGRTYMSHVQVQIESTNKTYLIAKAIDDKNRISDKLMASAIEVKSGDLSKEQVDLVVVCSTSALLLESILSEAGDGVRRQYNKAKQLSETNPIRTKGGNSPSRYILFLPCQELTQSVDRVKLCRSIRNFVATAVQDALTNRLTSLAFPAIGCGKLGLSPELVANEMLIEAQEQLSTANAILRIDFVLLPNNEIVRQAFLNKLSILQQVKENLADRQFIYPSSVVKITIISSEKEKENQCKKALVNHVKKSVLILEHTEQYEIKKWPQPIINAFYKYCLNLQVLPEMNINDGYIKLSGPKESVTSAEIEFLKVTTIQTRQAHVIEISRYVMWTYETINAQWEKYNPDLNARIEDAYRSNLLTYEFLNNKYEQCQIDFKNSIEICFNDRQQRSVMRHTDAGFPQYWEPQSEGIWRFQLKTNSTEFNEVLGLFDKTMIHKYKKIIQIERIQNKRWYMQYNIYKRFSKKNIPEKKLFHGCQEKSSDLIIHSFFNRSFAGIHGTMYGYGAYFSAKASYSHDYTTPSGRDQQRCMFLATVFIGDTIKGNDKMKTAPSGYDSTTDGDHIFVTYCDDQAYGEYLITYI